MPVFTHKIGSATSQRNSTRHSSAESKNSQNSGRTAANMIAPFPAPHPAIEPFPAPKINPFPPPKIETESLPSPRTPIQSLSLPKPKSSTPPSAKKGVPNVPPADYRNMVLSAAKVKSVLSGDSLILCSQTNPDAEKTLSLAYCTSPHLKKDGDEQWAFESRDALRKLAVGVNIQFTVLYTIPNTKREYGLVYLNDGRRLPEEMLKQGWLKLREDAGRKEESPEAQQHIDQLRVLEAQAKADDLGMWQTSGGRIDVQHDMGDSKAFLEEWKGKDVRGIIERVLSGDRMLVRILASPTKHYQLMTLVAGIRAPTTERVNPSNGQVQAAEEFGNDARRFVESRLLQREVLLEILGLSPQGQLIATIKHPRHGTIAKHILEAGLARCSDFHSTMLGGGMAELRAAEKVAQDGKKGVHKDHVAKSTSQGSNLEAQVTKVFSADVIFVQNRSGVEKRINLSSIRGPRQTDAAESPFRDEAKEFLRKKTIGKKVRLSIDGTRPANGQYEAKEVATITLNDKNINLLLVQEGWCSVVRHKRDDSDRAPNYDELLAAEEVAKKDGKGMWSGKPAKAKQYADASESLQKAKLQVGSLQRQKKIPGIVDFVKGGSRFVVLIPRESIKVTFVLSGIRAPKSARNATDKSEPGGQEAHDLALKRLTQRDVEIDVRDVDKVGGFIGDLYINKESFAKILVEEGLASVYGSQTDNELSAAEQRAKDGKKGIWKTWDPSIDAASSTEKHTNGTKGEHAGPRPEDYRQVVITHIDEETGRLKVQQVGTGTSALETMMAQFSKFHLNPSNNKGLDGAPRVGDYVAAKFTEDGEWYRARITGNDRTAKTSEVRYIDYGNGEKLPWSRLRPLQPDFSTSKLRGQAFDAVLSLIQLPTNKEYLDDAVHFVQDITAGKELIANVDFTGPDGTLFITLGDAKAKETINAEIIAEGHAMVPRKLQKWELSMSDILKGLSEKQEEAIADRRGLWEYGDLRDD